MTHPMTANGQETPRTDLKRLLGVFANKHYAMAADEWKVGASESSVRKHYDEAGAAERELIEAMEQLEREASQAEGLAAALEPFNHPDLRRLNTGNAEGDASPVFGRDGALLTIGDFKRALSALAAYRAARGGEKT